MPGGSEGQAARLVRGRGWGRRPANQILNTILGGRTNLDYRR